jgi:phosphoenolpyruvate carboxykinase (ATP)
MEAGPGAFPYRVGVSRNLSVQELYGAAQARKEGIPIGRQGPLLVHTAPYTGRSPQDRYIVREPSCQKQIRWGTDNQPVEPEVYRKLKAHLLQYLQNQEPFVLDCQVGRPGNHVLPLQVITEKAWQNLFARNLFIPRPNCPPPKEASPPFTLVGAPGCKPPRGLLRSDADAFILIHLAERTVLIGGTAYAGEIKKSAFSILNYLLPLEGILPMHCSANRGPDGTTTLFFGLSGTGKTTLSNDPDRLLIGDDEHGWSDRGIFNFEGGCYAKVIRLSQQAEPQIYDCVHRYGTVLENVVYDPETGRLDLDDDTITENTRAGYPLTHLKGIVPEGTGSHPTHLVMLTCDAFGVMPPISRLTVDQAVEHFLAGYTAKVAGTERNAGTEPTATFSTCFGGPFMTHKAEVYARLFSERIRRHQTRCWLVNTGWTGGPFGVGHRIPLAQTRAMIRSALGGELEKVPYHREGIFGLEIPERCPGVPQEILSPKKTWKDPAAYERKARELAERFKVNARQYGL